MAVGVRQRWERATMLAPGLLALAGVTLFPGVYLLYMSVMGWTAFSPVVRFAGVDNFRTLLRSASFWEAAGTTLLFVTLSTGLSLLLGLALALALNEDLRGRGAMRTLLTLPLIVPPVVAGFGWKFLLSSDVGVIGAFLLPLAGIRVAPMGDPQLAMASVVLADIWSKTSFMFLITLAGLQAIPPFLYEAARIDGAGFWAQLRLITLPLLKGVLIIAVILRVLDAINTFDVIFVMTQGGPGTATATFSILGWKIGFTYFDLGQAAALAVLMMLGAVFATNLLIRRARVGGWTGGGSRGTGGPGAPARRAGSAVPSAVGPRPGVWVPPDVPGVRALSFGLAPSFLVQDARRCPGLAAADHLHPDVRGLREALHRRDPHAVRQQHVRRIHEHCHRPGLGRTRSIRAGPHAGRRQAALVLLGPLHADGSGLWRDRAHLCADAYAGSAGHPFFRDAGAPQLQPALRYLAADALLRGSSGGT